MSFRASILYNKSLAKIADFCYKVSLSDAK